MISVLIPYRSTHRIREKSFDWLIRRYKKIFPAMQICVRDSETEVFNRSKARNNAFNESSGDVLLVADADTIPMPEELLAAQQKLEAGAPWVIPYGTYYNLGVEATQRILRNPVDDDIIFDDEECEHIIQSTAGMLMMPRRAWNLVDGYDERFEGWGYEDNSFQLSLDTVVGKHERIEWGRGIHLWHPAPETVRFEQPMIHHNRQLYEQYVRASRRPEYMRRLIDERLHV